jgi:hypothetical protein
MKRAKQRPLRRREFNATGKSISWEVMWTRFAKRFPPDLARKMQILTEGVEADLSVRLSPNED